MSRPESDQPGDLPCSACRGTGRVQSRLGGEDHSVDCPWCDGGGIFLAGHDAQRHWADAAGEPSGSA